MLKGCVKLAVERKIVVALRQGLHARPASEFIRLAQSFQSKVFVLKGNQSVDGKSILSLMSLAIGLGTEIIIRCEGIDEEKALVELCKIIT